MGDEWKKNIIASACGMGGMLIGTMFIALISNPFSWMNKMEDKVVKIEQHQNEQDAHIAKIDSSLEKITRMEATVESIRDKVSNVQIDLAAVKAAQGVKR